MQNDIVQAFVKSFVSAATVLMLSRILGKKQLAQFTFYECAAGLTLSIAAAVTALDSNVSLAEGSAVLFVFTAIPLLIRVIYAGSGKLKRLIFGKPVILVENGRVMESNLRAANMSVNDVLDVIRLKHAADILDVEFAVLETDGSVSVRLQPDYTIPPPGVEDPFNVYKGLRLYVIVDGEFMDEHLRIAGTDRGSIMDALSSRGITDIKDVRLAYIDGSQLVVQQCGQTELEENGAEV